MDHHKKQGEKVVEIQDKYAMKDFIMLPSIRSESISFPPDGDPSLAENKYEISSKKDYIFTT